MRRGRVFIYLAIILILGLVAVVVIWQRFLQPTTPVEEGPVATEVVDLVDVIVVTQTTPRGTKLDETILGIIPVPRVLFIAGMFTDMSQVVGRRAKFDLDSGIPLTASMLVESTKELSDVGSLAALSIPRGMVAVSIPIKRLSSVSFAPRSGDHVSVIVTLIIVDIDSEFQSITPNQTAGVLGPGPGVIMGTDIGVGSTSALQETAGMYSLSGQVAPGGGLAVLGRTELDPVLEQFFYLIPSERQRPRLVSQTLLPDVIVLQVGNFILEEEERRLEELSVEQALPQGQPPTPPVSGEAQAPPPIVIPDVITLIVSPQDAVTLNYLMYSGAELTLALRAAGDETRMDTEAVSLQYLLDIYNIPPPNKLPFSYEPRIDDLSLPILQNDLPPAPPP